MIKRTVTANGIEEDGVTSIYTERLNDGAIIEKRPGYSVAQPKDFKVGQRIRIYLGYYRDKGKIFANEKARQQEMEKKRWDTRLILMDILSNVASPLQ